MELRLTFQEISSLIEKKAGRSIPISYSSTHSVRVAYDVNILFKSTSIGLDLTIDQVLNNDIYLSFDGGMGIDFMVRQAVHMAKSRPGGQFIESLDGNRLLISLSKIDQAGSLLEHITLKDIRFDETYAIIEFEPKAL